MDYVIIALAVAILVLLIVLLIKQSKTKETSSATELSEKDKAIQEEKFRQVNEALNLNAQSFSKQLIELSERVSRNINDFKESVGNKFEANNKSTNEELGKIIEKTAKLEESAKELKEFSTKVEDLEKILADNKSKGGFGEYQLEQILFNTYGEDKHLYETQTALPFKGKDGETLIPDSCIKLPKQLLCIDSKFPLEAYKEYINNNDKDKEEALIKKFQNDVELKIKEVTKYIIPGYTSTYAVMFVPSDGIVSLLHQKCYSTIEKAQKANVIITSPSTIVPLISSIKIVKLDYERNEKADEIFELIKSIGKDFATFTNKWLLVSKQAKTVTNSIEDLNITVGRMYDRFNKLQNPEDKGQDYEEIN